MNETLSNATKGFVAGLAIIGAIFVVCFLYGVGKAFVGRRRMRAAVEQWRKERRRARIKTVGTVTFLCPSQPNSAYLEGWQFSFDAAAPIIPQQFDPISGELIVFGWGVIELQEIAKRGSEFVTA